MLGTYIAAHYVDSDWGMSFIVPGFVMGVMGFVVFMFLIDSPELVGMQHEVIASGNEANASNHRRIDESDDEETAAVSSEQVTKRFIFFFWLVHDKRFFFD